MTTEGQQTCERRAGCSTLSSLLRRYEKKDHFLLGEPFPALAGAGGNAPAHFCPTRAGQKKFLLCWGDLLRPGERFRAFRWPDFLPVSGFPTSPRADLRSENGGRVKVAGGKRPGGVEST